MCLLKVLFSLFSYRLWLIPMESAQTQDEDSLDSGFQTPSTNLSSLDSDSDDSSNASIDTMLLNFIFDVTTGFGVNLQLIRNDAINRLRMTPDMIQKLKLIESIATKYGCLSGVYMIPRNPSREHCNWRKRHGRIFGT